MKNDSKILNITHADMDGCGCSIILGNVFKSIKTVPIGYSSLDNTIFNIGVSNDYSGFEFIIITDLNLRKKHIVHLTKINIPFFILDHHQDIDMIHNGKNIIINEAKCGTTLTKSFIESICNDINLSHLDILSETILDYDLWLHKKIWSKPLNYLYGMYGFVEFKNRFMNGFSQDGILPSEQENLLRINEKIHKHWSMVKKTMMLSDTSKIVVIYSEPKYMNEMCDKILQNKINDAEIVFVINTTGFNGSIRTSRTDINMGEFLSDLKVGGGHKQAAGFENNYIKENKTLVDSMKHDLILQDIEKYIMMLEKKYPVILR